MKHRPRWPSWSLQARGHRSHWTRPSSSMCQYLVATIDSSGASEAPISSAYARHRGTPQGLPSLAQAGTTDSVETMGHVHGPVVSGTFYPSDPIELRARIDALLEAVETPEITGRLMGLIVPHAGLVYSGPVAAIGFSLAAAGPYRRTVLIGPSHFSWFGGIASLAADGWRTPLGTVALAPPGVNGLVRRLDLPYAHEHCLEVELPFLQETLPAARVTPLLFGDVESVVAGLLLDRMLDEEDLLVVSSDLSHYLDEQSAIRLDTESAGSIVSLDGEALGPNSACGRICIQAAIALCRHRGWRIELLDLATSADTAGGPGRVVGYGAFAIVA